MVDALTGYRKSPDGPYDRAVALTPAMGEVDPTLAAYINAQGLLVCVLAGDTQETSLYFDYASRGLMKVRLKRVVSFTLGSTDQFSNTIPAVVGLY